MGCKPSKGASEDAVVASASKGQSNNAKHETTPTVASEAAQNNSNSRKEQAKETTVRTSSSPSKSPSPRKGGGIPGVSHSPSDESTNSSDSKVYKLLIKTTDNHGNTNNVDLQRKVVACLSPRQAQYRHPKTGSTPMHVACRLLDTQTTTTAPSKTSNGKADSKNKNQSVTAVASLLQELVRAHPKGTRVADKAGHIPLHYAIAPTTSENNAAAGTPRAAAATYDNPDSNMLPASEWTPRTYALNVLLEADPEISKQYLSTNNVVFERQDGGACSPLYRALQTLPDDFTSGSAAPTVEFVATLRPYINSDIIAVGNASDGDKPLALLYRRFTRQFDLAEKFFSGDNSRPEVVQHRTRYKTAAGNTWKIIEILLRPEQLPPPGTNPSGSHHLHWRVVHRAVQVETPPDLLRYIVETNAEDLTVPDHAGNLPLHYAAKSKPSPVQVEAAEKEQQQNSQQKQNTQVHFPAFYTKYVVDELLYKFPEAASMPDAEGRYPLTLAVRAGKQWIGGGIKSLHDAFPPALKQINLEEHISLKRVLSLDPTLNAIDSLEDKEEKLENDVIRDEQHDAIMLVQQPNVDITEVVTSMWAHEEDAGVQMLGCIAVSKMLLRAGKDENEILRIALSAVAGVVNAMKAHPNEVIVQEKACQALQATACTDGKREISFVASGAVAAIVGAMQAHVSDPGVQQEACAAVAAIIHYGGDDRATVVASVSGLTAIVNAIAAHPDVVGVQEQACRALVELTNFPTANLPELPRSQTEPLLLNVKQKYPKECGALVDIVLQRLS